MTSTDSTTAQTTDSATTETGTVTWDVVTPESVKGQYNDRDRSHALRAYRDAISASMDLASPGVQYALATGQDFTTMATDEQRAAGEAAFAESLSKSDEMRAARRTESNKRAALNAALYPPAESDSGHGEPDDYCASDEDDD